VASTSRSWWSDTDSVSVPAGKTFVVTTISGYEEVATGQTPYEALEVTGPGYSGSTQMPIKMDFAKTSNSDDIYVATDDVDMPFEAHDSISLASGPSGGAIDIPQITLVGYLI
jgi:hypothetical protein